jgi:hypothetical protein
MADYILEVARDKGIRTIYASVLHNNSLMLQICKNRGFTLELDEDKTVYFAELDLEHAMPFETELPF